ncbi:MAG: ABC transporter ATP-binding protein, partial [Chloroflexota bacterium]
MLEVKNLTVGYHQTPVLKDVSFCLRDGEMLAVIGPNGAGKSTLVRALSGVIPPQSGSIRYNGRDLTALAAQERARVLTVVPQARHVPAGFTGWQVVSLGRTPYLNWFGQISPTDELLITDAMRRTNTLHLAERMIGELSGGELQRLLLARALA